MFVQREPCSPLSTGCAQVSSQQALWRRVGPGMHSSPWDSPPLPLFAELSALLGFTFTCSKMLLRQDYYGNGRFHDPSPRKHSLEETTLVTRNFTCPSTGCPPSVPSVGRDACPTKELEILHPGVLLAPSWLGGGCRAAVGAWQGVWWLPSPLPYPPAAGTGDLQAGNGP